MNSKLILVVDDTPDLRKNITQFLTMEGYATITAENGQDAIDKLHKVTPDLIITDILMPIMDGYTLIEYIRSEPDFMTIPVVVYSAKPAGESKQRVLAFGGTRFISKPGSIDVIMATVNEMVTA